jgi:hypothetical protein
VEEEIEGEGAEIGEGGEEAPVLVRTEEERLVSLKG